MNNWITTLNDLPPGEKGIIREIHASVKIRQRLMDLGIIEGATVEMVKAAPFGDPIQIKVLGSMIALRRSEAMTLFIEYGGDNNGGKAHRHRFGWQS